ncbi:hypothetical protein V491_00028 [Pseudogymnoascus sp. VKM F-3775]|nr:hypothetical protein V491_00028 [Pseudogymnoascus sp. VKM F-3775]
MIGVISTAIVITSSDRRAKAKKVQPGNREWVTVIQGVSSQGWAVPPFVIVAGKNHLVSWYKNSGFPSNWVIAITENGWTTNERGIDWIQHFEKHIKTRSIGGYRLLVLDGHESHYSDDFEEYYKEHNIITLYMPAHSSHLLQPLDVGCFSPLKKAYSRQIEDIMQSHISHITKDDFFPAFYAVCFSPLKKAYSRQIEDIMQSHISHITKDDFFPAFHTAFNTAMTESNIQGGFRGAGLLPFDPERVISTLDLRLKTLIPPSSRPDTAQPWVSQIPNNPTEAISQSTFIKNRIAHHQNSSPTSIYTAVDQFTKGASQIMHQLALLKAENQNLQ